MTQRVKCLTFKLETRVQSPEPMENWVWLYTLVIPALGPRRVASLRGHSLQLPGARGRSA